jgi:hypothetical protein
MIDLPAETLSELREGMEIAQAALADAVTTLAGLIPEPTPRWQRGKRQTITFGLPLELEIGMRQFVRDYRRSAARDAA